MSPEHVPPPGQRRPKRPRINAARLLVVAILALHGLGRAAEAAAPAVAQDAVAHVQSTGRLADIPDSRLQWTGQGAASAPRMPRPDAPRLGGGQCCWSSECRCGCLSSMAAIAIDALGGRL